MYRLCTTRLASLASLASVAIVLQSLLTADLSRAKEFAGGSPAQSDLSQAASHGLASQRTSFGGSASTVFLTLVSSTTTVPPGGVVDWQIKALTSDVENDGLALVSVDLVQSASNPGYVALPPGVRSTGMENFDRPDGVSNPPQGGGASAYGGTQRPGQSGGMNLIQIGGGQNTFGAPGEEYGLNFIVAQGVGHGAEQEIAHGTFNAPSTPGTYSFLLENAIANVLAKIDPPPSPPDCWPVYEATVDATSGTLIIRVR